ncbi:hypothetical protein [Pseudomonas sp. NPDC089569]|uniref:hypothetical protein n=1 Tax=Pseudomonas sp. NPDC089569 TaxID=3390722 RepID=UPI003D024309
MADQTDVTDAYGGQARYKLTHEALARALAEPDAQGAYAHGARAAFLLSQIAPQLTDVSLTAGLREFERLGAPPNLLVQMRAFIAERDQLETGNVRSIAS